MKVLVIAAHPDDEVLGCGGAIAQHVSVGDEVHVEILAEGIKSRLAKPYSDNKSAVLDLKRSAEIANGILGVASLTLHGLPDNRLDSMDRLDIIQLIENKISTYSPKVIYTHHCGDVNIDHRIIHEATNTACRPLPGSDVCRILYFEVPSSSEWQIPGSAPPFLPNWFVDISSSLATKINALDAYNSEMRSWPHPRSLTAVEHLAKWRGASVGLNAAEAFVLGRNIM
jgi:LmbE family N-acetylglucosaminyl deacetylase